MNFWAQIKTIISIICIGWLTGLSGCRVPFFNQNAPSVSHVLTPNPATVVIPDHEFAWNQIVDEVDDYFKIKKEERVRLEDGIITEGVLTTFPCSGSTLFEPWRKDSTHGFEKLHATLQTIRRSATVRVIPAGETYMIDVQVIKEIEDLPTPENSAVGIGIRSNVSARPEEDGTSENRIRQRWYPIGRDTSLEQRILANIIGRLRI